MIRILSSKVCFSNGRYGKISGWLSTFRIISLRAEIKLLTYRWAEPVYKMMLKFVKSGTN